MSYRLSLLAIIGIVGIGFGGCKKKTTSSQSLPDTIHIGKMVHINSVQTFELVYGSDVTPYECTDANGVKHTGNKPTDFLYKITEDKISAPADVCPRTAQETKRKLSPEGISRIKDFLQQLPVVETLRTDCPSDGLFAGIRVQEQSKFIHILPKSEMACVGSLEVSAEWEQILSVFRAAYDEATLL